jgi:hypothetical protein
MLYKIPIEGLPLLGSIHKTCLLRVNGALGLREEYD